MNLDYDIHGMLGLRLEDPAEALARAAARQLDPIRPAVLRREPDVVISHFGESEARGPGYRLGDAGDNQHCFFDQKGLTVSAGGSLIRMPFDAVGSSCDIRCTENSGMRRLLIDYVRPALQLSLLTRGAMALHSAAAMHEGKGILFAGWAESGKTEAMLGFLQAGASFVSDKWTIVDADGSAIYHFPTPITVRDWMIDLIPGLRGRLKGTGLIRARAAEAANSVLKSRGALRRVPGISQAQSLAELAGRISVTHNQLFSGDANRRHGWQSTFTAPLDTLVFLLTRSGAGIEVRPVEPGAVAGRLADCALYERRTFFGLYQRFRYAFPEWRNTLIESARDTEVETLMKVLSGKRVLAVEAPFPFKPAAVYEALRPFV